MIFKEREIGNVNDRNGARTGSPELDYVESRNGCLRQPASVIKPREMLNGIIVGTYNLRIFRNDRRFA